MKLSEISSYSFRNNNIPKTCKNSHSVPFRGEGQNAVLEELERLFLEEKKQNREFTDFQRHLISCAFSQNILDKKLFSKILGYRSRTLKPFEIAALAGAINKNNLQVLDLFFVSVNPVKQKALDSLDVREIAGAVTKINERNRAFLPELLLVNYEGQMEFSLEQISRMLPLVNEENIEDIKWLVKEGKIAPKDLPAVLKAIKNKGRETIADIYSMSENIQDFNNNLSKYSPVQQKYYKMLRPEFAYLAANVNEDNINFLEENLANDFIPLESKLTILPSLKEQNLDLLDYLLKVKNKDVWDILTADNITKLLMQMPTPCLDTYMAFKKSAYSDKNIFDVLSSNKSEDNGEFIAQMLRTANITPNQLAHAVKYANKDNHKLVLKLSKMSNSVFEQNVSCLSQLSKKNECLFEKAMNNCSPEEIVKNFKPLSYIPKDADGHKILDDYYEIEKMLYNEPERFVNGDNISPDKIKKFLRKNSGHIMLALYISDKPAVEMILSKRFEKAHEFFKEEITKCGSKQILKRVLSSRNKDNCLFSPAEKLDIITLFRAHETNNIQFPSEKVFPQFDIEKVKVNFFGHVMSRFGINPYNLDEASTKRMCDWNLKYAYKLKTDSTPVRIQNGFFGYSYIPTNFSEMIVAATEYDFKSYIQNDNVNYQTKKTFEKYGLNYNSWFNPSPENYERIQIETAASKDTQVISNNIMQDITELRNNNFIRKKIDKIYQNFIKPDGSFELPQEIKKSAVKLYKFVENLNKNLAPFYAKAEENLNAGKYVEKAQKLMTIKSHITNNINLLRNLPTRNEDKNSIDLTVKMWDRYPQKDLFQGNYTNCCIAIGEGNEEAMNDYLSNSTFNMIEVVDNETKEVIGNAVVYFVKHKDQTPGFMIDNVELANKVLQKGISTDLIKYSLINYAVKVCKEVCGNKYVPIYMGTKYNDIKTNSYKTEEVKLDVLGHLDGDQVYLDVFNGWIEPSGYQTCKVFKIV